MQKKKILITGGSGLLGVNCAIYLRNNHLITLGLHKRIIEIEGVTSSVINMQDGFLLNKTIDDVEPNIVIHAAGLTNVDKCEENKKAAYKYNVNLTQNLVELCKLKNITFVHISTDHLFSGDNQYYAESSRLEPLNVYGETKAEAEQIVQDIFPESLIIRTNFFGWGPVYRSSFSDVIIDNLQNGKKINLFQDVFYTPISIVSLVDTIMKLIASNQRGVFNVVGDDRVSKYDFGLKIAEYFNLDSRLINAGFLCEQKDLVQRPSDMSLSNKKVSEVLGLEIGGVDKQIQLLHEQDINGVKREIKKL